MANIDKSKHTYNKMPYDIWNVETDEHNPTLLAKKVEVVGGAISAGADDMVQLGDVVVGLTAVKLVLTGNIVSIEIQSALANVGVIYIGKSDVANDGTKHYQKLEVPGALLSIPFDVSLNDVWIISDTAGQKASVGALKRT